MGRPIDADALIDALGIREATKYGNKDSEQSSISYGFIINYELLDVIEDQPTVPDINVGSKWISVSERVPDHEQDVLVTTRTKKGVLNVDKGYYAGRWVHRGTAEVIAWKELPEPYEEALRYRSEVDSVEEVNAKK